jgi:hypothetical protein
MIVAQIATHTLSHISTVATWLLQDTATPQWDPLSLWRQMNWVARAVVVILFIMSG